MKGSGAPVGRDSVCGEADGVISAVLFDTANRAGGFRG
jgi:hypothetical protein